jgi:hypothetical protein
VIVIVAFTSFSINLYREVFYPVMSKVSTTTPGPYKTLRPSPLGRFIEPKIGFATANLVEKTPCPANGIGGCLRLKPQSHLAVALCIAPKMALPGSMTPGLASAQEKVGKAARAAQSFFRHSLMKALRSSPFLPVASALQLFMRSCWRFLPSDRQDFMNSLRSSPFLPVASVLQVPINCCWAVLGLSPAAMLMLQARDTTARTTNFFMMV